MSSTARFDEKVQDFVEVSADEANSLIEEKNGHIVTVMRNSCPYCRKFVNKLHKVKTEHDLVVNYLNSQGNDQEGINRFREKYGVQTVPSIVYSSETAGTQVKCDSSLSKEEIEAFFEVV